MTTAYRQTIYATEDVPETLCFGGGADILNAFMSRNGVPLDDPDHQCCLDVCPCAATAEQTVDALVPVTAAGAAATPQAVQASPADAPPADSPVT